jgi:hypothetical protein
MGQKINMYGVLVGGAEGNFYLEDLGVDGNLITKHSPCSVQQRGHSINSAISAV